MEPTDQQRIEDAIRRGVAPVEDPAEREKIADWIRGFIARNDARFEARRRRPAA